MSSPNPDATTPPRQPDISEPEEEGAANREAAKYRHRLRATESERDQLAGLVSALQRDEAERLAADHLAVGADLFDVGRVDLANLLAETGRVDPALVAAAVETLLRERPGLRQLPRVTDTGAGVRGPSTPGGPTWGDVLKRR